LVIDIFCHFYPKKYLKEYPKAMWDSMVRSIGRPYPVLSIKDVVIEPIAEFARFFDPEARLKCMDNCGIDTQVLSLAMTPIMPSINDPFELIRIANDAMVEEFVEKYPDRFVGVANLASLTGEALDELDRCINDLGLKGVQIFTNMNGKPLDSREFLPFYEKMAKYDLPILIHPTEIKAEESIWIQRYCPVDWPFYSTLAMGMIISGGILQKFPNLKFVIHHLGGGIIPFYEKRIGKRATSYKMFYADTATNGSVSAMRCGYDFFGPEHIVFATDYPYFSRSDPLSGETLVRDVLRSVKDLDIPEEHKQMIFEDNARKLLKL